MTKFAPSLGEPTARETATFPAASAHGHRRCRVAVRVCSESHRQGALTRPKPVSPDASPNAATHRGEAVYPRRGAGHSCCCSHSGGGRLFGVRLPRSVFGFRPHSACAGSPSGSFVAPVRGHVAVLPPASVVGADGGGAQSVACGAGVGADHPQGARRNTRPAASAASSAVAGVVVRAGDVHPLARGGRLAREVESRRPRRDAVRMVDVAGVRRSRRSGGRFTRRAAVPGVAALQQLGPLGDDGGVAADFDRVRAALTL